MSESEYIVERTDDSHLQSVLNANWQEGYEPIAIYPRGSAAVFVVFQKKS